MSKRGYLFAINLYLSYNLLISSNQPEHITVHALFQIIEQKEL